MMAATSEDFINQFHNIQGKKITERKKNLYLILKSNTLSSDEKKLLVENLKPKNYLETVFHADVLIYLKDTGALLELLKTGNDLYVSKIIKQTWFFQEIFNNIPAKQLVEEVLPTLSYSVKIKVLKKLMCIFPSSQIDNIFDVLESKYGFYFALRILPGCSINKIENMFKAHNIKLSTGVLKLIHKKDTNLIKTYFDEMKSRNIYNPCDDSFYVYLAEKDPSLFWEILVNNKPKSTHFKLGRRITKKLLPFAEQKLINEPNTFIEYFKEERIVRILNKQGKFSELYKNLFPDEITDLIKKDSLINVLKYYPEKDRYALFKNTFENVFVENLWDNLKFVDDYFMQSVQDRDLRTKWAQLKLKDTNDIKYIKYYDINTSIPLIKEKINVTSSISARSNLVALLLATCAVNEDMTALEQVLKYYWERHRNEESTVRDKFLDEFRDHFEKKYSSFTETIWKYFIDIITLQLINKDYSLSYNSKLIVKFIEYLYVKNEVTKAENAISKFFPEIFNKYNIDDALKNFKSTETERKVLIFTYKSFDNIKKGKDDEREFYLRLLMWLCRFYKNNDFCLEDGMKDVIKQSLEVMDKWEYPLVIQACIDLLSIVKFGNFGQEVFELLWQKEFIFVDSLGYNATKLLLWALKSNPDVMVQYFDKMVELSLQTSLKRIRFWPYLKHYSHLGLDAVIKTRCIENLSNLTNSFVDCNSIIALSYFLNTDEYLATMKTLKLFPTKYKLDAENEEETRIFKLQKTYIKMLKNTNEPSKYLSILLEQFCQGDFLQDSLLPLYKAFSRLPETSLKPYLKIVSEKKNISIQKHTVSLACNLLDKTTSIQTLQMFKESKNKSLKKALFSSALKYFCKNSCVETFEIIINLMKFLTEEDVETFKALFKAKIDKSYREEYLQNAWKLLDSFKDNSEINNIRPLCLKAFEQLSLKNVPASFCKEIISVYFLSEKRFQTSEEINQFVINFLLSYNEEENYAFVFNIISAFKSKVWLNYKASDRREIRNFVTTFIRHTCKQDIDTDVLVKFFRYWKTTFSPYEDFDDYLLTKFAVLWKENTDSIQFAIHVVKYLEEINQEYGYIMSIFACNLSEFLKFFDTDKERVDVLYNLLNVSTQLSSILVIELLKLENDIICEDRMLKKYSKIDIKLKQLFDNVLIKIKYNSLLRQY